VGIGVSQPSFFEIVRGELQATETRMRAVRHPADANLQTALDHLLSAGGKRIRPTVALLAGHLVEAPPEPLVNFAAAVEMLHTATLVHDDLIDGALLRRGIPTLNSQWTPGATVLTGDFIFAWAAHLGAQTDSVRVMVSFARTLMTIINGELAQMFGRTQRASREEYDQRIYAKTAALFELAGSGAALITVHESPLAPRLGDFGRQVGMAFQIVDDILDFTADSTRLGKPVGNDLRQGLITLPVLCYGDQHPEDQDVQAVLNPEHRHQADVDRLVEAIARSEAIAAAMSEARRFASAARDALHGVTAGRYRDGLLELADFVVARDL
jgi:geranylgeranyl pyrophosphate synthase